MPRSKEEIRAQVEEAVTHPRFWSEVLREADGRGLAGTVIVDAPALALPAERQRALLIAQLQNLRRSLSKQVPRAAVEGLSGWKAHVDLTEYEAEGDAPGGLILHVTFTEPAE